MKTYSVVFAIVMGIGMFGMWALFFLAGDVPELSTEPIALGFHLAAEAMTASFLLVAGIGLARGARWAGSLYLVGLGAFAYTVVVSPGYFAEAGEWSFVLMFGAFLLAAAPAAVGAASVNRTHADSV